MLMPESMKLTTSEVAELNSIREAAKYVHEKARKAAKRLGRHDFPMLPYACSWAYEMEFRRKIGK